MSSLSGIVALCQMLPHWFIWIPYRIRIISFVAHYLDIILLCWTFDINACLDTDINITLLQDHDVVLKWCTPFVGPCGKIIRIQHSKNNTTGTICLPTVFNTVFCFFYHMHMLQYIWVIWTYFFIFLALYLTAKAVLNSLSGSPSYWLNKVFWKC